jgi:DHA3 family macrolide efflux protein-like MFS transporter
MKNMKSPANTEIDWKKNTTLFLAGQGVSLFGSMLVQYAIGWYVTLKTGSGSMMTVFIITGILPMFFISPFSGVWADRFNRKNLINIADGAIAFATLLVAVFFLLGFEHLGLLLFCAGVRALGQGVQTPAVSSFIPQIVPEDQLTRVNGINGSIQSFTMLIAPMASGALLSFASIKIIFFLDVLTAVIGIGIVFFWVKVPAKDHPGPAADGDGAGRQGINYFRDIREGLRYIHGEGYILRLVALSIVFFVAVAPTAFLTPLQVMRDFGAEVWRLTALELVFSGGMMLGGIVMGLWGGFKNKIYSMALSCVLFGIEAIALGLINNFWLYLGVMAIMGLTMPLYNTPSMALLQSTVDPAYMGRVFSVFGMASSLMMPAGMMLFGPLADVISIDMLLIVTGGVMVLLGIPFIGSRVLREAGGL